MKARLTPNLNRCRGASLLEVMSAIVMLSITIPPLLGLFTQVAGRSVDQIYQDAAVVYAEALMEEIVSKKFEDPQLGQGSFGKEEKSRLLFDDVDDFDGLENSPPIHLDGSKLNDLSGFTRSVVVENVSALAPDAVGGVKDGSTNLKRIQVTVKWSGGRGGELWLSTLRSRLPQSAALDNPIDADASAKTAKRKSARSMQLELVSIDAADVRLEAFSLGSTSKNELVKLKLHSKEIWRHKRGKKLPIGKTSMNRGSNSQRTIPAGERPRLELQLEDKPRGSKSYTLTLYFSDGRSSVVNFDITW